MLVAPYGTWTSPISAEATAAGAVRLSFPRIEGTAVYWIESRPSEEGRCVLVRREDGGEPQDVLPAPWSVRTLVHEYGGSAYAVHGGAVWFVNFVDQRVYRYELDGGSGEPTPVTPEPPAPRAWRYADLVVTPDGRHLLCVRERHDAESGEVVNDLAAFPADGSAPPEQVAGGHDFFGWPRPDPDGRRLAWVAWDHPRMPWDGTLLYEADLGEDLTVSNTRLVAGGDEESVVQPAYGPGGRLHYVSDRTGWWNLYADEIPLAPMEAEFAHPAWLCGMQDYGFLADGSIVAHWRAGGTDHLGVVSDGAASEIDTPFTAVASLHAAGDRVVLAAASGALSPRIALVDVSAGGIVTVVRETGTAVAGAEWISLPEPIDVPLADGGFTHALWYPPRNPDHSAPDGELPPVIVSSHGGPTSAVAPLLDWSIQYWTSRGIGVVDVNYGGSTGYGRPYRERLRGRWGVVDLDDCIAVARWLADQGLADPGRLLVHGGSAGGYTTLCALAFRDTFAAGASYFGVADLRALAEHTHKFESRYLDGLVGPWPEARELYEERSPVLHADRLRTPMILFQGLEDMVVPPAQAEVMVDALRRRGVPFAYVAYEGEQHGIRQAANIRRTVEAELYFYGRVLGFEPAGDITPVEIEHAEALKPSS